MNFGKNLQALRKAKNITQETLAEELNISRQAIGKWESGTVYPDAERLIQISEYFGISLDSLVKGNINSASDVKDDSPAETADNNLGSGPEPYPVSYRNRIIRLVTALSLFLISPFIPGEPGAGTIKSFLMLLCITGGIALLVYNHLSKKGMEDK